MYYTTNQKELKELNKKVNKGLAFFGLLMTVVIMGLYLIDYNTEGTLIPKSEDLASIE